ncbi:hypothetical protein [Streptomyces sp. S186]|uniref:hypothetical protein n=1 Tax=Streptomyces sp. S186 TaxID=3434395 RepID=UPI003F673633
MHWPRHATEAEYAYTGDADNAEADSALLRTADFCGALTPTSTITFGITTGQ